MPKSIHDNVLDAALDYIKQNGTGISVVMNPSAPTTYANAWTDVPGATGVLATETMATTADYTISNGDTNGRKVAVSQKADITIDYNGTADHIAIVDTANTLLLLVTTCTAQVLTSGGTVTINTFDDEIADPT